MVAVLLNLIDAESIEELREAEELIGEAGAQFAGGRMALTQRIFQAGRAIGRRETLPFSRVPVVGEYLCLPMEEDLWYRVEIVLHTPLQASHEAEVWALETDEKAN